MDECEDSRDQDQAQHLPGATAGARMALKLLRLKAGVKSAALDVPVVKPKPEFTAPPKVRI